jgi:hypothetical protein
MNDEITSLMQIITRRTKRFRNLVVVVAVCGLAVIITAAALFSWLPLWGLTMLIPLCAGYLYFDARLVNRWRQQVLAAWAGGRLKVEVFKTTVNSITTLPTQTVQGMLASLPDPPRHGSAASLRPAEKEALARTIATINSCQSDRTLLLTLATLVGLASAALASLIRHWLPLVGLVGVPLLLGVHPLLVEWRLRLLKKYLDPLAQSREFKLDNYRIIAEHLDWSGVAPFRRRRFMASLHG